MGYQLWVYTWPENQECQGCEHYERLLESNASVCHLNHNKTKEAKCSCSSLLRQAEKEVSQSDTM